MECRICYDEAGEKITLDCNEKCNNKYYHKKCIEKWFRLKDIKKCPYCTKDVVYDIEKREIHKWAIRDYTREQVYTIMNTEFKKITYGNIYYPIIFMIYILGGYHGKLGYNNLPLASMYLFVLERNNRIGNFMLDITFFHFIAIYIFYFVFCKSFPENDYWIFYFIYDFGIYIYTFQRLEKIWNHYQFEQPSYILFENIHISVRDNIHDNQWVD